MKRIQMKKGVYIALIVLMLASLACSLGDLTGGMVGGGDADVEESGGGDAGESGGGDAGESGGGDTGGGDSGEEADPSDVDPDALSGLNSYRSTMIWRITPAGGEPETLQMTQEETRDPHAMRFTMDMGPQTTEFVQIGDTSWLCSAGSCVQSQQSEEEFMSQFGEGFMIEPSDVIPDSDYQRVGRENVNGIRTQHYRLSIPPAQAMMLTQGTVDDVESEVWIADERDLPTFVVRFRLAWEGTYEGEQASGEYIIEVTDINAPFTIEPPEGAEDSGLPEDIPTYPNATDFVVFSGNASFTSSDSPETVADFYRNQLPTLGWTNQDDQVMGEMINQTWGKEGRTITLMITPQDGGSGVVITME